MAETLGLPDWQVEQMVREMRSRPPVVGGPMPGGQWLKTQLWKWAVASVLLLGIGTGGFGQFDNLGNWIGKSVSRKGFPGKSNRAFNDGIYRHTVAEQGRAFGMKAPPGFSYEIIYGTVDAAANGDSENYLHVETLSKDNLAIIQEQYTNDIIDGFDKAIKNVPPDWVSGQSVGIVKPNYYPGRFADPIDITLNKDAFPYDPASKAGKALHSQLLDKIKDHWENIITSDD